MQLGEELLTREKFVLIANMSCLSAEICFVPDAWMLQGGSAIRKQPGEYQRQMPSIVTLLIHTSKADVGGACQFFRKAKAGMEKRFLSRCRKSQQF